MIQVGVEPADPTQAAALGFDWYLVTLEPTKMEIQLMFEKAYAVSMSSQSQTDNLQISFQPEFLKQVVDAETRLPLDFSKTGGKPTITKQLPAQLPKTRATRRMMTSIATG